jgi:DNA-binding response OmpR family regulator/DNA-binding CsgD family transcriptional regulator
MMSSNQVVLVVDDSIDTIHMLNDVLESEKFTVLVALEGAQALTITQNMRPDIILLDAVMPHMDGFETCQRLKQIPQLADVPIIFMTGLSDTEHIVKGLGAGGVDYVTKPIKTDELIARMRVHLANAHMTQTARAALDTAGHYLLTLDLQGQLRWATPQAHQLLSKSQATQDNQLQNSISKQLRDWLQHKPDVGRQLVLSGLSQALSVEVVSVMDGREYLLRLTAVHQVDQDTRLLRQHFAVTGREADVLLWIAKGKTNREIAQILDMSPRTVNKHLEQIFRKLGVENRTSAAATTLKCLAKG